MIRFFPSSRIILAIGPITITWYAVLILAGAYLAYRISLHNIRKIGYQTEDIENLFFGALLSGIVGSRIWYVLFFDLGAYIREPLRIFQFWEGGLAIQGGLIAGAAFGYYYTKKYRLNFWQWADQIVPNILLAQAIGRWGNFMNQEAYGQVVSESYFRYFPEWFKNMMLIGGEYYQPTFLYESVLNVIGWILIVWVLKRYSRIRRGDLTFAYLMWYGVIRLFIEQMRSDSLMFFNFRIAQLISLLFIIVGALGYFGLFRRGQKKIKPVLLFDFDLTIMDTQACIFASFQKVFAMNKPDVILDDDVLHSFLGPTLDESFAQFFPQEQVPGLIDQYRQINRQLHDELVRPVDHAVEVLTQLKNDGYQLGIVSNKVSDIIQLALTKNAMDSLFDVVVGKDSMTESKPHPEGILTALSLLERGRDQVVYVGDADTDIEAGKRAGSFTIGYLFDNLRKEQLEKSQPNRIISDLRELLEILKEDHEWTAIMM